MKTTVIGSNKGSGKINSSVVDSKADNKGEQPKTNGLQISKEFDNNAKDEPKKAETAQATEQPQQQAEVPKAETVNLQAEQPKAETGQPQPTAEVKTVEPVKHMLNLEGTLKLVEELFRRKKQRDRLLETIDTLETFEVAQIDDADETEANHFQGCVLTIEDDNRRKFTTKNPFIIQAVAQYVNRMCVDRLSEIEAGIIIPA